MPPGLPRCARHNKVVNGFVHWLTRCWSTIAYSLLIVAILGSSYPVSAHPHAWIDLRVSLIFDADGSLHRLRQEWLLDPSFSLLLLQDWESSRPDTTLSGALEERGQLLLQQLREYDYFTELFYQGQSLVVPDVTDSRMELHNDRLYLRFDLVLELVRPPPNQGFSYRVFDPSYWIEILHDPDDVIHLEAGMGCTTLLEEPRPSPSLVLYAARLDRDQRAPIPYLGRAFAQTVHLGCQP